jgi:hypothetical protein
MASAETPAARGLGRLIVMCLSGNTLTENVEMTGVLSEGTAGDLLQVDIETDMESGSSNVDQWTLAELCKKCKHTKVRALIAEEKHLLAEVWKRAEAVEIVEDVEADPVPTGEISHGQERPRMKNVEVNLVSTEEIPHD